MTELRIDGVAVELPSSFSISIKRENPFFTKSGEYTYDIELPLESSVNAELYSFLHRINSVADIKQKRRAVLTADNRVYLDGTEVITGWTENSVKIQLVSGNSELNYIADETVLLASLKMPVTDPRMTGGVIDQKYIEMTYPDVDFCLPMVARADGTLVNSWGYVKSTVTQTGGWYARDEGEIHGMVPMPFLVPYLNTVISALGYTVTHNALEDSVANCICLIHSQKTYDWSKMFPGMTVREFLENIENTFNVSFKIDFRHKEVEVLLNRTYFFEVPNAFVQNVADEYDCDYEEDDDEDIAFNSKSFELSYDFPSSKYYNEAALSDYVKDIALVVDNTFTGSWWSYFDNDTKSTEKIYQIAGEREKARYDGMNWADKHHLTGSPCYHYVDFFQKHVQGDGKINVKMKMLPAEVISATIDELDGYAVVVAGDTTPRSTAELKLDDILAMDKKDEGDAGRIRMAFYKGLVNLYPKDSRIKAPIAFTDFSMPVAGKPRGVGVDPPLSFRPSEMATSFFIGGYDIDISHPIKIRSFDVNLYSPSSVFVIHNKRFLCREIEYIIGPDGRQGAWQGVFYPAKLSDQETYKRWILSDGRWRDGGVWLDDGRWLDDKPINHDTNTIEQ